MFDLSEHLARSSLAREAVSVAVTRGPWTQYWCSGELPTAGTITPDTTMYGASLTKQLIGALTARAIADGVLGYGSTVADVLDDLPAWASRIEVRHLLHHTSALPAVADGVGSWPQSNDAVLTRLQAAKPPLRPPGELFKYSNTGYVILAEMLRRAWGHSVEALAHNLIFQPLQLGSSRLGGPAPVVFPDLRPPPGTVGDGGWWASVVDVNLWLQTLNTTWATVARTLETPGVLNDGTSLDYGWGVRVFELDGRRTVTHGGTWPGWLATSVRQPEQGIAVAVLSCSTDEALVRDTALALAAAV